MDKVLQFFTAVISAIAAIIPSCSTPTPPPTSPPPSPNNTFNIYPPYNNPVPPSPIPPTVGGYKDDSGGYRLHPLPGVTGSEAVGVPISDPDKLLQIAIENTILIDSYLNRVDAKIRFEHEANKSNLQKVIDWTAFIASYRLFLEQKASANQDLQRALYHINNLDNYRRAYNAMP